MIKLIKCARVMKLCGYLTLALVIVSAKAEAPVNSYLPPAHGHGHNGDAGQHDDHHTDLVPPSSSYGTPDSSYGPPHHQSGFHPDHAEHGDHHDQHDSNDDSGSFEDEPAKYEFSYEVDDEDLSFGHEEMRDGDYTTGKYNVLLPDGRRQIVEYEADHKGYRPKITYEGGDVHPHHHDHPHEHGHEHDHGHGGYSKESPHTQLGYPREAHHDFDHNGIAHGSSEYDSHGHDNGHDNGHSRADHGIHDGHRGYDNNAHEYHSGANGHGHGHHGHNGHNGQHHNGHNGHHRRRSSNINNHHRSATHHKNDNRHHNGYHN